MVSFAGKFFDADKGISIKFPLIKFRKLIYKLRTSVVQFLPGMRRDGHLALES